MTRPLPVRRWSRGLAGVGLLVAGLTSGCNPTPLRPADFTGHTPVVRVELLSARTSVAVTADVAPTVKLLTDPTSRHVEMTPGTPTVLTLTPAGWQFGNLAIPGRSELTLTPAVEGSVRVAGKAYRGRFRFVPRPSTVATAGPTFDVVNDVDVENYLRGVVAREMPPEFEPAAYAAQAVVARTFALYTARTASSGARFDLFADERSQVYGGLSGETFKAVAAVEQTAGEVVAYGPAGEERIFKAYYSSCCGGIGQSAADAFGDPPIPPLAAQRVGTLCAASPSFNWPPVTVSKAELTRRLRHWGQVHNRPVRDMAAVRRIDAVADNGLGRPVRFTVGDVDGKRYPFTGEEIRTAVNTDAPPKARLLSSLFRVDDRVDAIAFVDGHGRGHGVGMCQWCAQGYARRGMDYRQIVRASFPGSTLLRAY